MSEVSVNDPHQPPAQPERTPCVPEGRRFADEDRAWTQLYCAVLQGNPSTAEEVIEALDADPQSKHSRLALYTQAKTALRRQDAAEARRQRIAAFLRTALTMPVLGPIRLLRSMLSTSADVAVDMLPPARREPAVALAPALVTGPAFARARVRFGSGAEGTMPSASAAEDSGGPKAA